MSVLLGNSLEATMSNSTLLAPGIKLMERLSFRKKFAVLAVLFTIPIIWLTSNYLISSNNAIQFSAKERIGVQYLYKIYPITKNVARVRGLTNTYLSGNTQLKSKIDNAINEVNQSLEALAVTEKNLQGNFLPTVTAAALRTKWNSLHSTALQQTAQKSFAAYSEYIYELNQYTVHIADISNLILDPDLDSYYLMDALVTQLPKIQELLGRARGLGSAVAQKQKFNPSEFTTLVSLVDEVGVHGSAIRIAFDKVYKENESVKSSIASLDSTFNKQWQSFIQVLNDKLIQPESISIDSNQLFAQGSAVISEGYTLYEGVLPVFDGLLEKRISAKQSVMYQTIIMLTVISLLVAYLFMAFSQSVINSVDSINDTVGELSNGNFQVQAAVSSKDEVGSVAENLNNMVSKVSSLLLQVVSATNQVASSAEQASSTAAQAQDGINRQNSEIEQVATAINEMSATVHEVAQNTASAADLTQTADGEANSGRSVVSQAIDSINRLAGEMEASSQVIQDLETQSESIGSVLDVIRGIAEQTNLLALNAAIEAARAGEQGRGFAVVADEVRTLASRTQESTEEINDMIGKLQTGARAAVEAMTKGTEQTGQSVDQAVQAGAALDQISSAVSTIHDMNTQIASAAEEQSSVSEEINRNIVNIRDIAEATVEGANQTASSSENLTQVAGELLAVVNEFKI